MNILILNWRDPKNPQAGGAEYVTLEHAKYWVKKGHLVTWFTTSFAGSMPEEAIEGIRILRKGNQISVFFHAFRFYSQSKKGFSIIVDEIHGLPFFTPLYAKVPVVAFIHEVAQEIWDYMYPFPLNIFGRMLEKHALRLYSGRRFWTDASSTIDDLVHIGVARSNCLAIPCPIPNKPLTNLPSKEKDPTFIFVGRLVPMKGIEDVIQAFSHIVKAKKYAKLWIVGQGSADYTEYLKRKIELYSLSQHVKFWGYVSEEEKLNLMKKSHVLLHGSIREGWGLVVLEAASQATPTIAYNISGLKDTVIDGKTGILVEKRDPIFLAKASLELLKDPKAYSAMQHHCLVRVRSLRWEEATEKSLELLQEEVKAK